MTDSIYYERPRPQLYTAHCLEPACPWRIQGGIEAVEAGIQKHEHQLVALTIVGNQLDLFVKP